jgi:hypothetical protein
MAPPPLSYWDYVRAAFLQRVRVPGLGALPANVMGLAAFAVLGLANPGFWLLGAAGELAYLGWLSGSSRFQKLVQGTRLAAAQEGWDERVRRLAESLDGKSRRRYQDLLADCRRAVGISESLDGPLTADAQVAGVRSASLNQLLWIFLRLLRSRELIRDNLASVDRKALAGEIGALEARLAEVDRGQDAALARSLEGTLEIQRRRLANLDRAASHLGVLESELDRIERHVELIREEAAVSGKTEVLSDRLDAVTSAMSETQRWMSEHAEFLSALGGTELAEEVAELPSTLPLAEEEKQA